MNLSAMSISDLMALQDALGLIQKGALILSGLPDCGEGDLVVQMRPGEPVTLVTSWVMPAAQRVAASEPVVIEDIVAPVVAAPIGAQAKAAMRHAAALCDASVDLRDRSEGALQRAEAVAAHPNITGQPAAVGEPAGKAGGGSGKVAAPRVKTAERSAPERVTGPLSEAERLTIVARMDVDSAASIALDLKRRVQEVSLFIHNRRKYALSQMTIGPVSQDAVVLTGGPAADASAPDTGHAPAAAQEEGPCAAPVSDHVSDISKMVASVPPTPVEIVPPAPPPSPALAGIVDPRPARHRAIAQHVDRLKRRPDFDAELDLELAEALAKGAKVNAVAADFGLDSAQVKARWQDMTNALLDAKGRLAVDDQTYLLIELRRKVQEARSRAA